MVVVLGGRLCVRTEQVAWVCMVVVLGGRLCVRTEQVAWVCMVVVLGGWLCVNGNGQVAGCVWWLCWEGGCV